MTRNVSRAVEQRVRDMVALWWAKEWTSLGEAARHFCVHIATVRNWAKHAEARGWMVTTRRGNAVVAWHVTPKGLKEV